MCVFIFNMQLQLVTENGCDVNISNEDKESLLMFTMANSRAPGERRAELIRVLLQRGADVNSRNAKGQTTFMYACIMNQVKPLKVLLEQVRSVEIHANTSSKNFE